MNNTHTTTNNSFCNTKKDLFWGICIRFVTCEVYWALLHQVSVTVCTYLGLEIQDLDLLKEGKTKNKFEK